MEKIIISITKASSFVKGVINLRSKIIPIIDLRRRFDYDDLKERDRGNRIIVIDFHGRTVGMIIDAVTEVLRLDQKQIDETENFPPPVWISSILMMGLCMTSTF